MLEFAKRNVIVFIYSALILSTLLVFWQVRNFDFVNYDDSDYVYENLHVLNGLTPDGIIWAFTTGCTANWHPITWLSLMLDCQLFGTNPGWMHLMNLILHLVNTLLLFAVLKKMTGSLWPSAFVAAAFALHPMHVESVAWIAERKDVLSTLFWLLTMVAYLAYVRRHGTFRYALTLMLFVLGLMAKPMLVTLPFVLLLLDYWPLKRFSIADCQLPIEKSPKSKIQNLKFAQSFWRLVIEKIPFLALAAVSSVITFFVQHGGDAVADIDLFPLQSRVANAFLSYTKYIGKMFWPQNLSVFYPFGTDKFLLWQITLCVLLLLGISFLVLRFGRTRRYLPLGWFWFLGTLVPVIGLVQVGGQSLADRYSYIPYIGLFIMIAWGLPELLSKWPQRKNALGLSMVIVLTTLGICAHRQVSYWNNSTALFSHAIEVTQNNDVAHNNLGVTYGKLGRYQDAVEACKQAIRIKPDYAEAHCNLGVAYGKLGRYQDAIESYQQAIRIKPDYAADAYYNLGVVYSKFGRHQDAIESFKQAIKINPDDDEAHFNLGVTYYKLGRYQDAIESYKQAIRIKPDYAGAHYNLGVAYLKTGDKGSALEEYKILKTLDAELANKLFNLINK
jgi:Flp pilus assembly protein TadD